MNVKEAIFPNAHSSAEAVGVIVVAVIALLLLFFLLAPARKRSRAVNVASAICALSLVCLFAYGCWVGFISLPPVLEWARSSDTIAKFVWSILAVVTIWGLGQGATQAIVGGSEDLKVRHKVRRTAEWLRTGLVLVALLVIWGARIESLGVFLGIVGAGLALSLQELLLCLVGWVYAVWKKPFDIGDRIEVAGKRGDVIDVGPLHTTMLEVGNWIVADQSTGRLATVPNSVFLRETTFNFTKGFPFVWDELVVVVTFESDWERAKQILGELSTVQDVKLEAEVRRQIEAMQDVYPIHYRRLSSIVYTSIVDHGIALSLRYLTPVRSRRGVAAELSEGILRAFATEPSMDFAYPTTRFYDGAREGTVRGPHGKEEETVSH